MRIGFRGPGWYGCSLESYWLVTHFSSFFNTCSIMMLEGAWACLWVLTWQHVCLLSNVVLLHLLLSEWAIKLNLSCEKYDIMAHHISFWGFHSAELDLCFRTVSKWWIYFMYMLTSVQPLSLNISVSLVCPLQHGAHLIWSIAVFHDAHLHFWIFETLYLFVSLLLFGCITWHCNCIHRSLNLKALVANLCCFFNKRFLRCWVP